MKIIFLDIDGVLNSHQYLSRVSLEEVDIYEGLDPEKSILLQMLIEQTGQASSYPLHGENRLKT